MTFLKGYRTYLAVLLTALVFGLGQIGILTTDWTNWLVGLLTASGLYFRSKA